jgi:hypothetical protein
MNTDEHGFTILFVSPSAKKSILPAGSYVSLAVVSPVGDLCAFGALD